ncbi:MAG: hypothetical protein ABDH21_02295 [bacterium]
MRELLREDFERLNKDYLYVAKRKFNVELSNDITSAYISDVLISLYFEGHRTKSKLAISLVGSFIGQTVIQEWGGYWVPESFSIKAVGINKIQVNPFSIAHQRLTKGVNKTIFEQLSSVALKANNQDINEELDNEKIQNVFNRLFDEGWWPLSIVYKKNLPNYVRHEMAYTLGLIGKYVKDQEYIKSKLYELMKEKDTVYYACVAFQNCLYPEFIDPIIQIIESNDYSNNIKAQAILALTGIKNDKQSEQKIIQFAQTKILQIPNPLLKFYFGNLLGNFDNPSNINWIIQKIQDPTLDEITKLALLVAIQLLRKKEFVQTLISILMQNNTPTSVKDEIIKTLHLLPINEEIYNLLSKYNEFDMKNKVGFINIVLFSDFKDKKELLSNLLSQEKEPFVKSYILSALDSISYDSNSIQ